MARIQMLRRARHAWVPGLWTVAAALICQTPSTDSAQPGSRDQDAKTVRLVVDYADGVEKHFTTIQWKENMTVFDAMQLAAAHPRGIKFKHTGSGATAFLTEIDDLKNQGGGSGKKNWIYRVNDKLADKSFGVYELKPSDTVNWRFGKYSPEN